MTRRRTLLSALRRQRRLELAAQFDVVGLTGKRKEEIVAALAPRPCQPCGPEHRNCGVAGLLVPAGELE